MFNAVFKLNRGSIGDVALHNTVVKIGDALAGTPGVSHARQYFRNNLFIGGAGGTYNGWDSGDGAIVYMPDAASDGSYDYDGFGSLVERGSLLENGSLLLRGSLYGFGSLWGNGSLSGNGSLGSSGSLSPGGSLARNGSLTLRGFFTTNLPPALRVSATRRASASLRRRATTCPLSA